MDLSCLSPIRLSPKKSVSKSETETNKSKSKSKSKSMKKVSFSKQTKTHDGLRINSKILETVVDCYFNKQCIKEPNDYKVALLHVFDESILNKTKMNLILEQLYQLCSNMNMCQRHQRIPVLIKGGGHSIMLSTQHRKHVHKMTRMFQIFVNTFEYLNTI
jgi:hypothetical protein